MEVRHQTRAWRLGVEPALLSVLCFVQAHADIDTAKDAYLRGDYEQALRDFTPCAERGHPEAQFNLAAMYFNGNGTPRNRALAYAWFSLAAENGIVDAGAPARQLEPQLNAADRQVIRAISDQFGAQALRARLLPAETGSTRDSSAPRPKEVQISEPSETIEELRRWPGLEHIDEIRTGVSRNEVRISTTDLRLLIVDALVAPDGSVRDMEEVLSVPAGLYDKQQFRYHAGLRFALASPTEPPVFRMIRVTSWTGGWGTTHARASTVFENLRTTYSTCAAEGGMQCQYVSALLGGSRLHKEEERNGDHAVDAHSEPLDRSRNGREAPYMVLAAQGGHAWAQYRLGRALAFGAQSEPAKARAWLELALEAGVKRAAIVLARLEIRSREADAREHWRRARQLLEIAWAGKERDAALPLAALLGAAPEATVRDPEKALQVLEEVRHFRGGHPGVVEIAAAAEAARGDFKRAVARQKKAISEAEDLKWDLAALRERLASYESQQPWFGDLLGY